MAPIAIAMLPRMSANPINRLLRVSVEGMPPSSSMMEVAFCSMSLGERRGFGREDLGCGLFIDGVGDRLGLVLRPAQFVEQRLGLLPVQLVLLDGPMARKTIHLGAPLLDLFPERRTFAP